MFRSYHSSLWYVLFLSLILIPLQLIMSLKTDCSIPQWIGDGYCDDMINTELCNYDGGDCCGSYINTVYCSECECCDAGGCNATSTIDAGTINLTSQRSFLTQTLYNMY